MRYITNTNRKSVKNLYWRYTTCLYSDPYPVGCEKHGSEHSYCTQYQLTSAPTLNLLSTAPIALSINTYGTNNATSLSGLLSVILDAIFLANVSASSFDWGFSFQFPEMNGLRAFRAVELTAAWLPVVVNAVAEPNKREARASFMV